LSQPDPARKKVKKVAKFKLRIATEKIWVRIGSDWFEPPRIKDLAEGNGDNGGETPRSRSHRAGSKLRSYSSLCRRHAPQGADHAPSNIYVAKKAVRRRTSKLLSGIPPKIWARQR